MIIWEVEDSEGFSLESKFDDVEGSGIVNDDEDDGGSDWILSLFCNSDSEIFTPSFSLLVSGIPTRLHDFPLRINVDPDSLSF